MIDREVSAGPDGAVTVTSGPDRADFMFLTRDQLGRHYPGVPLAGLPERGCVGLVIATEDIRACENAIGKAGVGTEGGVLVALTAANGVLLVFEAP